MSSLQNSKKRLEQALSGQAEVVSLSWTWRLLEAFKYLNNLVYFSLKLIEIKSNKANVFPGEVYWKIFLRIFWKSKLYSKSTQMIKNAKKYTWFHLMANCNLLIRNSEIVLDAQLTKEREPVVYAFAYNWMALIWKLN